MKDIELTEHGFKCGVANVELLTVHEHSICIGIETPKYSRGGIQITIRDTGAVFISSFDEKTRKWRRWHKVIPQENARPVMKCAD